MILFLILCKAFLDLENKFIQKLREEKYRTLYQNTVVFNDNCYTIIHNVFLQDKYRKGIDYVKFDSASNNTQRMLYYYSLEVKNDLEIEKIKNFIKSYKSRENHLFIFKSELGVKEKIKSLKYLLNELEKYQVDKVKGCVDDDTRVIELYKLCKFYNEIKNNSLTVLCFYQINNVTKKIKIEITDFDVTEFIKEYLVSNLSKVSNKTHEQFFLRNLCNCKMILRDLDSVQEDIILLQNCQEFPEITLEDVLIYESEETKKDKKKYLKDYLKIFNEDIDVETLFTIFKMLLGTDYFLKSIKIILSETEKGRHHLFKAILKNLNVDVFTVSELFIQTKQLPSPSISKINEYYSFHINERIESLKVSDDVVNYKSLLLFFYQYIEIDSGDHKFFKSVNLFFKKESIISLRHEVIKKINRCLIYVYKSYLNGISENIVLDFYDERITLKIEQI